MINWIKNIYGFKTRRKTILMDKYLIVGLGNIGSEYINTRHNIGFKILDFFINQNNLVFQSVKLGTLSIFNFKGKKLYLLKPNTYMNLSGKAVQYWMEKENIIKENILIIADDLNLDFGTFRIRHKGSDGGHNGFKNISLTLNTTEYPRCRFGISDAFKKGQQINYVLGEWTKIEQEKLYERYDLATQIIKAFVTIGLENTMSTFNGK